MRRSPNMADAGNVILDVYVIPRAPASAVAGTRDGALLVRLNAPPVDGAANEALIELLARSLGLAKRSITIIAGLRSRRKKVRITGVSREAVEARLSL